MNAPVTPAPVRTTCPYCGVGCGVLARPDGLGGVRIDGDGDHPANLGRLCSKGSALGETLSLDDRLLHPMLRDADGHLQRASWDAALGTVARGFRRVIDVHGPDAVAFYVSGQLLTEDYYVANKLMKGFVGSGNIDTNSRLCMASSVAAQRRAFGADTVPGCYEDLDRADLLVLVGSNAAWCHPILYQRMVANRRARGARIVVVDPRATATAEDADLVLRIAPGMDTVLFSGLLAHLAAAGAIDQAFVDAHTSGFPEALTRARLIAPDLHTVARRTGLAAADIQTLYDWFTLTPGAVTLFSQGVNQSAQGTDKANAIINCHLATGRIGRPGMGPFSLTGQPNAMGGREVGGLANQLAAHMGFEPESIDRVGRFWRAPRVAGAPGLKAVELFDAIHAGRIKALWVMGTNPAASLPRADHVAAALGKLDLLVVSDVVASNDTIRAGADVLLPAAAWGEKDGTVTNSERRISRQRAFMPLPGEARPDWWIVTEVARRMGHADEFHYRSPADVFREHAALSTFENDGTRDLDLGGLAEISDAAYEALAPVQWPVRPGSTAGPARMFADGRFFTASGRATFAVPARPALASATSDPHPLLLNTGRVRDQWHTMTRTGKSPRLSQHIEEPFVAVHPTDAQRLALDDGGLARVVTAHGTAVLRVRVDAGQRRGEIFAPIHWTGETSSSGRVGALVQPANDPFSGQPEMKATPAAVSAVACAVEGFLLSRTPVPMPRDLWWVRVKVEGGFGYRIAADAALDTWPELARRLVGGAGDLSELSDPGQRRYRAAAIADGVLQRCLFLAGERAALPRWDWLKTQLAAPVLAEPARRALLAGAVGDRSADEGAIVCACHGVGEARIKGAIANGCATVDAVGAATRAGTNCGSCIPEIRKCIAAAAAAAHPVAPAEA